MFLIFVTCILFFYSESLFVFISLSQVFGSFTNSNRRHNDLCSCFRCLCQDSDIGESRACGEWVIWGFGRSHVHWPYIFAYVVLREVHGRSFVHRSFTIADRSTSVYNESRFPNSTRFFSFLKFLFFRLQRSYTEDPFWGGTDGKRFQYIEQWSNRNACALLCAL